MAVEIEASPARRSIGADLHVLGLAALAAAYAGPGAVAVIGGGLGVVPDGDVAFGALPAAVRALPMVVVLLLGAAIARIARAAPARPVTMAPAAVAAGLVGALIGAGPLVAGSAPAGAATLATVALFAIASWWALRTSPPRWVVVGAAVAMWLSLAGAVVVSASFAAAMSASL